MTENRLSEAIRLQDIMIARATGDQSIVPQEYIDLRLGLLSDPPLKPLLPEIVVRCHSLSELWNFIQPKFRTYRERRDYISGQFDSFLTALENGTAALVRISASDSGDTGSNQQSENSGIAVSAPQYKYGRESLVRDLRHYIDEARSTLRDLNNVDTWTHAEYENFQRRFQVWDGLASNMLHVQFTEPSVQRQYDGPLGFDDDMLENVPATLEEEVAEFKQTVVARLRRLNDILRRVDDFEAAPQEKSDVIDEDERALPSAIIASARTPIPERPRIFVASSKEGLLVANAIHERLDHVAEITVWDQGVFDPSSYTLEALEQQLDVTDCAIFVFSPDDISVIRKQEVSVVRDNVLFELGLFIGRLGRKRCFIIHPRDNSPHLASDLRGMTTADYDDKRSDDNLLAALAPGVSKILRAIDNARIAY